MQTQNNLPDPIQNHQHLQCWHLRELSSQRMVRPGGGCRELWPEVTKESLRCEKQQQNNRSTYYNVLLMWTLNQAFSRRFTPLFFVLASFVLLFLFVVEVATAITRSFVFYLLVVEVAKAVLALFAVLRFRLHHR